MNIIISGIPANITMVNCSRIEAAQILVKIAVVKMLLQNTAVSVNNNLVENGLMYIELG